MELQLVKKYDARAWDGVVVPLGEGNLNSYQGPLGAGACRSSCLGAL